ncbi:ABC transporter permease subunit [Sinorhizobium medicae]|uniref:ABC transporter permease n=3 Tax=Sinorhizobium medicae TaxID=110321 RepID=A0A6G1WNK5_9HYPH|nr:ABC transporter permease subunit [Sinorhizobium medicae]ABR60932.1 binding-protein-dependent transport systems inner membrane component [Sinorhizobium medicae WSM419]MBO1943752.1 ABC transporter permease subunit [Sinorhizobium medicae]MBO1964829.1 ABC transporter permease subunit [Sinorhizobium medicae]MDX0407090.1 ABC transporter permease subunit [Sinorhizobium medicae]MDX0412484.1 ABC transporter permease subunit [Sinorhizobium medicae]
MNVHHAKAAEHAVDDDLLSARRRRNRIRYGATQFAVIAAAITLVVLFALAVKEGLARHGIRFSFSFLWDAAGFDLSEGKTFVFDGTFWLAFTEFTSERSIAQAFAAGIVNTTKVAVLAIVLSTMLGVLLGVSRLSTNWVARSLSFWCVEFVRNTPLLIQLVFWYFAVILHFPPIAAAAEFYGVVISQQGLFFPALVWKGEGSPVAIAMATACWVAILGLVFDKHRLVRRVCMGAIVVLPCLMLLTGIVELDFPVASKFRAKGGTGMSPEMAALLLAIVVNSASYIAEIVRGAIDALPKGQWEAAASLGLSRRDTVHDIILPQVFRVVLPSFGNQYISLTKNTALGIAVGYPELFNIYGTIANQTGHSLEGILIVMASYLILSWAISATVAWADRRLSKRGAM